MEEKKVGKKKEESKRREKRGLIWGNGGEIGGRKGGTTQC